MAQFHIYGYDGCPFCQKAKALLDKEGIPYAYVQVGETREERSLWLDSRDIIKDSERTFPRIYIANGQREIPVGGYTDLESHILFG